MGVMGWDSRRECFPMFPSPRITSKDTDATERPVCGGNEPGRDPVTVAQGVRDVGLGGARSQEHTKPLRMPRDPRAVSRWAAGPPGRQARPGERQSWSRTLNPNA